MRGAVGNRSLSEIAKAAPGPVQGAKPEFNRFQIVRFLRQNRQGYTAIADDLLEPGSIAILKTVSRKGYISTPANLAEYYSWLRTQGHPAVGKVLTAGLGHRHELYWARENLSQFELKTGDTSLVHSLVSAVSFFHSFGYLHRHIRPSNVLSSNGTIVLVDARGFVSTDPITIADIHFTAPEILRGEPHTVASDLYSLGTTLYRLLSGRHVYEDADMDNLRSKYLLAAPDRLNPIYGLSGDILTAIDNLLSREPTHRLKAFAQLQKLVPADQATEKIPFLGRKSELATIQEQVFANTRQLSVISMEAAPGIGKTALLLEVQRRSEFYGVDFVLLRCSAPHEGLRFVVAEILARRRARTKNVLDVALRDYQESLEEFLADGHVKSAHIGGLQRQISDIIGVLARFSRERPLIVGIDDVHNASSELRYFLKQLCIRGSEISGHLVLAGRISSNGRSFGCDLVEESSVRTYKLFSLLPLNEQESRQLLRRLAGSSSEEDAVLANAGGSPFFIGQSIRGRSKHAIEEQTDQWIAGALGSLNADGRFLVETLSILQTPVSAEKLRQLLEFSEQQIRSALTDALRSDLISIRSNVSLRHSNTIKTKLSRLISSAKRIRLHSLAFQMLHGIASDEELAVHALEGHLYRDAIPICLRSAETFKGRGRFDRSVEFYVAARKACHALGQNLAFKHQMELAHCYGRLGQHGKAKQLYDEMQASQEINNDPSLKAHLYSRIAIGDLRLSDKERLKLYATAARCAAQGNSLDATPIHINMAQVLIRMGNITGAHKLLQRITASQLSFQDRSLFYATSGMLHLNSGEFQLAQRCFERIALSRSTLSLGVMINTALCCEHLGRLTLAKSWLDRSHRLAETSGYALIQIMSSINLGAVLTKTGEFGSAESAFRRGAERVEQLRAIDPTFSDERLMVMKCDAARLHLELGDYVGAKRLLNGVNLSETNAAIDNIALGLTVCDLWLRLGDDRRFRGVIQEIRTLRLSNNQFFRTELELLEATEWKAGDGGLLIRLQEISRASELLGTTHQRCRILQMLGSLRADEPEEARGYLDEALRIAKKNGYRPLAARAMMLRGLVGRHPKEKEHWLIRGYKLAAEIGIPELVAESAYHIGAMLLASGHMATAREYLLKSTATTSQILEHVPQRYRAKYMTKPWRRDARQLLQVCIDKLDLALPPSAETRTGRNDRLFRSLYHTNVAATAAQSVDAFTSALLRALGEIQGRSAVVLLKHADRTSWHPVGVELTDEIKKRISAIAAKAQEKTYLDYQDRTLTKGTVGWIPFRAQPLSGGIYVSCGKGESSLGENEIEFLTILGTLASSAFDRISSRRAIATRAPVRSDSYGLIGSSRAMQEVHSHIEIAAGNLATVLIEGETGTGKELVARAIHLAGARAGNPFIAVDCGAIPESLIESELFGAVRGAYTGAVADRRGLFESAHRGTLFLDEISNTSASTQAKLLRVLQEREVRRIGDNKARPIDVRLIAAANRNLATLVDDGRFRQDLLYRINVLHIVLPPLRNRRDDIPLLAEHFLDGLNSRHNGRKRFANGVFDPLNHYNFPGNVRELQNAVERAYFHAPGNVIVAIPIERPSSQVAVTDDVQSWFKDLTEGRKNFWTAVRDRYKRRDISREHVVALMDVGLRRTQGSYKDLAELFRLGSKGYRPLMDFLRRSDCLLDFRQYRKPPEPPGQ